jgi:hypothetical protein
VRVGAATRCASKPACASTATTSTTTTAVEVDLSWIVGWKKDDQAPLCASKRSSPRDHGFEMLDRDRASHDAASAT